MSDYLNRLKRAIRETHGVDAAHLETVPVREMHGQQVAWDGEVEVFAVAHSKASQCYAWGYQNDEKQFEAVAVLAVPPVISARDAVRAAIAAAARQQ